MEENEYKPYFSKEDRIRAKLIDYYELKPKATHYDVLQIALKREIDRENQIKEKMTHSNKKQILDAY